MKNYNETIKNATTFEEMEVIINELNNDILDNAEILFNMANLENLVKKINEDYKTSFSRSFAYGVDIDRKATFEKLVKNPNFEKVIISINANGTIKAEKKTAVFKFADLENTYQIFKSTETDKNGKAIKNKSVTVFGALRFYGLCDAFIRNLFTVNLTIDNEQIPNLAKIKIANKTIFDENDGKAFASNSNNNLEKQLNILARFFDIDVKMLKKDLPILKMSAQKIKTDNSNKSSIHELKTLKFADMLFSVITSRINNEDIKIFTNDGNEVKDTETETKAE